MFGCLELALGVFTRHLGMQAFHARDLAFAFERGCVRLDWAVLEWNQPAMEFYERLGARRHGGWHAYQLAGDDLRALAARAGK